MQRTHYGNPPPATSPPLHHPVPQHVSTVPQLRSPPPPAPQHQTSGYGNPYQQQGPQGGASAFGAYGGFMADPTAQMGFQVGSTALKHGTEYVEQNVGRGLVHDGIYANENFSSTDTLTFPLSNTTSMSRIHMWSTSSFWSCFLGGTSLGLASSL
jgi:hypothetical protein